MAKKIAILTTKTSWFVPYAQELKKMLRQKGIDVELFHHYRDIDVEYEIIFILSYFRIIPWEFLEHRLHKLVVHESDLPQGKGWAPLFWQILEGKNKIPVVLFEATEKVDAGKVYLKKYIELTGSELHDEIRYAQAKVTQELCIDFLEQYEQIQPRAQDGIETFYDRRRPKDSELDLSKSIQEQFNALRIASNNDYPAFFYVDGQKYILKIEKANDDQSTKK